jgi:hypothetical protein
MEKKTLAAASFYKQAYSFNETFGGLPADIKNEIKILCVSLAQKLHGVFTLGFYEDGSLYFEAFGETEDYNFDEIGAKLETDKLTTEKKELIKALTLWYAIYQTADGEKARKEWEGIQ